MRLHMLYGLRMYNHTPVDPKKITRIKDLLKMFQFLVMNIARTIKRNYKNNLIISLEKCNIPWMQKILFLPNCSR